MRISDHAYDRAKERLGFNRSAIEKLALKALDEGIDIKNTVGSFKRYLHKLQAMYSYKNIPKIYGDIIYIFGRDHTLITVLYVPTEYKKYIHKLKSKLAHHETNI